MKILFIGRLNSRLLNGLLAFVICTLFPAGSLSADNIYSSQRIFTSFPAGDGKLAIYSYHVNEFLEVVYRKEDRYEPEGLRKIIGAFRDRSNGKEHPIDLELIELLDHLQDTFQADSLELISGYRSPELNRSRRSDGADVAEDSMHTQGKAADIHLDEVTEEIVAEYLRSLKVGGIGYYPALDFVHVDTGEVRNWDLPDRPGRLLMAMRKGAIWQVTTDRNLYLPREPVPLRILNITRAPKTFSFQPVLEIFRRGRWHGKKRLDVPPSLKLAAGGEWEGTWNPDLEDPFGKYRITIPGPPGYPHLQVRSNEFYRKRR